MEPERAVSWMAIGQDAEVVDVDGNKIGHVESVLGDDESDIFHGLAVDRRGLSSDVELPAARITRITTQRVYTDLSAEDAAALEDVEIDKWQEFEGRSRFRKKIKWGDEE